MNKSVKRNLDYFSRKDSHAYHQAQIHILRRRRLASLICRAAKEKLAEVDKKINLAEIGVGDGTLLQEYQFCLQRDKVKITGVELSDKWLSHFLAQELIDASIVGYAEKLLLEDESQDIIVLSEVLEHVSTPIVVLKEIHRVLKKDGRFIGSVPNAGQGWDIARMIFGLAPHQLRRKVFDPTFTHESHFTAGLLKEALQTAGFCEIKLTTNFVRIWPKGDYVAPIINSFLSRLWPRWGDRLIWQCKK